ncbi:recombinase RecA [Candidatus Acetothermia bacterium]|jgi:recombination protein RecA|nr:recombinase RecA [Candidatus Acetothermia bacterium]MCI2426699.1 recombinase RecA [Candidatus Acetothermia bacterium]MCI2427042.1 recombinase RecA [Candidatus Acetothermia bacterium]MCI2428255.1 recombinase RecA [Candidatus Acetothermia bacterium]
MGKEQDVLENTLKQIKKIHGEGAIMWLGDGAAALAVDVITSGALALDIALGVGGIPRGRITEIYGSEGSGKTTLALHMLAETQKIGGTAAFIDAEHALDPTYARTIGVDIDHLLLAQPNSGEQALEIVEQLTRSGTIDIIVIDSVAALVPIAEIEGQMGDTQVGLQARLMSQAMRKLAGVISQTRTIVVFINQIRAMIGASRFGPATTTSGGRALKFYSSVRLNICNAEKIEEGTDRIGTRVTVRVVKNKVAPPFKEAQFDIIFGKGIVKERELLNVGDKLGIVSRSGSWYSFEGTRLGQGLTNSSRFLSENPKIAVALEQVVREKAGLPPIMTEQSALS